MKDGSDFEIFIGIVAPLGTERKKFIKSLKDKFSANGYNVQTISITTELINFKKPKKTSKGYEYFIKMEICSLLRKEHSNGFLIGAVIKKIKELRKNTDQKSVYIIDQIKHVCEYNILSHLLDRSGDLEQKLGKIRAIPILLVY